MLNFHIGDLADRVSDSTELSEQMHCAPEAGGRDQFTNEGGDANLLIHECTELEIVLGNDGILADPENSVHPVGQISDHKTQTMSNAIDDEIGHIDNEIDMTNRKDPVMRADCCQF